MSTWLLVALQGYLLGSIPFGYLVGRSKGIDVRLHGSGATGGTNVLRTVGLGPAILTGLGDLLKGSLAAYVGLKWLGHAGYALAGAAVLIGHCYPVWLRFKGGKGVATGSGILLLLHPWAILTGLTAGVLCILPTRYVSLGSLVGTAFTVGAIWLGAVHPTDKWLSLVAGIIILLRHRENIRRILIGTEHKIGQKVRPRVHS